MRARHLHAAFIGGELDPLMSGRVDTDNYQYGLQTCENFTALAVGPLVKRMGFEMIRGAGPAASWLSGFRFNVTQEYVLEWCDGLVRFYTNGGRIEVAPGAPFELAVPYTAAEAPDISQQQSFDRLYLDHPNHPPAAIKRTSATTFSYEVLQLVDGPFTDTNTDKAKTLTVSGVTGIVTLTANAPIFLPGQVGSLFRVEAKDFSTIKAWQPAMKGIVVGEIVRSDNKAYTAAAGDKTGSIQPTHFEGQEWDGQNKQDISDKGPYGVLWTYRHDKFGIVKIELVNPDGMSAQGTVIRPIPDSIISVPTHKWASALFSEAAGWPSLVTLWAGRMIHFKDFDMVASVVGDFGGGKVNFASFTPAGTLAADLAFRRTLATSDPPHWVMADRKLIVGTASRELAIGATNPQAAVSGDNITSDPQSFYGSQPIDPVQIGVQTIFVERGGRRLRAGGYDFARDRYVADDLTASARHVTASGIKQLAYQRQPYAFLHAVRNDGQLAVHSDSKADVKGFSRFALGGDAQIISACAIVGEDGMNDELWALVRRATPTGTRTEVWKQAAWRELGDPREECFFVDGGVRIAASPNQKTFSGLDHLAGQAVAVLSDGAVVPAMSVDALGVLTLPDIAVPGDRPFTVIVGLGYTATAITMPPEVRGRLGTVMGMLKQAKKAVLRLLDSLGVRVGGNQDDDPIDELIDRSAADVMDRPIPLFSGDSEGLIETAFDRAGQVQWVSDVPLPATITAAVVSLEVDEADV